MTATRLSAKEKREILSTLKDKTTACLQNRKSANCIVDILAVCENYSEEDLIIQACIRSFHKIFLRYIEAEEMYLKEDLSGEETGLSKGEQYKVWLCWQYQNVKHKLLEFMQHKSLNTQELAFSTLMKFVTCECCHPLRKVTAKQVSFPDQLFKKILTVLLSDSADFQSLLTRFKEYLVYDDVRFYTLKFLHKCCQEKQNKVASEILLNNIFALLENITVPTPKGGKYGKFLSAVPDVKPMFEDPGQEIFLPAGHKRTFTSVWVEFLRFKLPSSLYRKVLVILHEKVMPFMTSPLLLADFLTDSYNIGGVFSLLALNGLFILVHKYNLDYPDFYTKLYAMFESSVFHVKYRARFFHLIDQFLSSTHLPAYLVAAFAKRLARISLTAPPSGILIAVPFIYNLINRHPSLKKLIDRQGDSSDDPYDSSEPDPAKCRALESSLWELKTLQNHYHPAVSKVSQKINTTAPSSETDLSELLDSSENDLFDQEKKKKFKSAAVTFDPPKGLLSSKDDRLSLCWTLT